MGGMRLRYLPLRCTDLGRAQSFYGTVLGLAETRVSPAEFVQYDVGGAELCVDLEHDEPATPAAIIAVDDLTDLATRLGNAGIAVDAGGLDVGWLQVRDPDGNPLVFEAATHS